MNRYDDICVYVPIGFLLDAGDNWDAFCNDAGLNPCVLNEGREEAEDTYPVKIKILRKHGILNE